MMTTTRIRKAQITSEAADDNDTLTADGAGNADWEAVAGGTPDASDVTYTPTTATDWDGDADPGNVDGALDQLAERVDDLEGGAGHAALTLDTQADDILKLTTQELGLQTQTANTVLAGPTTGAADEPTFRALVAADVGSGTPTGSKYLKDNMSWDVPTGAGDVIGPATSTDDHLATWDGTNSKTLQDGGAISSTTIRTQIVLMDTTVGAGGQANFDLSSIPNSYDQFEIIFSGKSEDAAAEIDNILININNDSTNTNYRSQALTGNGTTVATAVADGRNTCVLASSKNANMSGQGTIKINHPGSGIEKYIEAWSGARASSTVSWIAYRTVQWENTAVINRITLVPSSGADFAEGSRCIIVGWKQLAVKT